jgi:hypothetical protein
MRARLMVSALGIALIVTAASATTWTVFPDSTGDAPTIQAGLDSAGTGDTVMVMCGTYKEYDICMRSGVHLTSETGAADCAEIDAGGLGRCLVCDGIGNAAIVPVAV